MNRISITNSNYDQAARESFKSNPATAFSWFLSASYCYYIRYESLLSDEVFDKMCKFLLDSYDKLEHPNKSLVTKAMLSAGSGYNLKEYDYPNRVKVSAEYLIENLNIWRSKNGQNS